MNSVATCEISQVVKIRNLGNSQAKFSSSSALELLQQHKTKNYEKISLIMRKFTIEKKISIENLKILRKILI